MKNGQWLSFVIFLSVWGCSRPELPPAAPPPPPKPANVAPKAPEPTGSVPNAVPADPASAVAAQQAPAPKEDPESLFQYSPDGRRDPFRSIITSTKRMVSETLPPLQRKELAELKLIGIVWGGLGYGAIIQTDDGKGYTVRTGTRIGINNGVVRRISTSEVVVEENYLDIFGEPKVREVVMELHPQKEGLE